MPKGNPQPNPEYDDLREGVRVIVFEAMREAEQLKNLEREEISRERETLEDQTIKELRKLRKSNIKLKKQIGVEKRHRREIENILADRMRWRDVIKLMTNMCSFLAIVAICVVSAITSTKLTDVFPLLAVLAVAFVMSAGADIKVIKQMRKLSGS